MPATATFSALSSLIIKPDTWLLQRLKTATHTTSSSNPMSFEGANDNGKGVSTESGTPNCAMKPGHQKSQDLSEAQPSAQGRALN